MRGTYNTLPFNNMPPRLVIEMVKPSVFWMNSFSLNKGVLKHLSAQSIVMGQKLDNKCHCHFHFGEYMQMHEEHDNSMCP